MKSIKIWQINLQHSKVATDYLSKKVAKMNSPVIVLVQEPYFAKNGKIPGFQGDVQTAYQGGKSRAAKITKGLIYGTILGLMIETVRSVLLNVMIWN